ncbi:MAG: FHA domain-containing protein [Myxococcales bacterium]|nr:FHA domain-containing protein [Myxococcales bacterium]
MRRSSEAWERPPFSTPPTPRAARQIRRCRSCTGWSSSAPRIPQPSADGSAPTTSCSDGTPTSCSIAIARPPRRHAELIEDAGGLEIADLGSRNGTRVRGAKVARRRLEVGDYVEVGSFGFLVARARERRALRSDTSLVGDSHAFQRVLAEVEALAASRATALVRGAPGTGRTAVAARIHARSRPEGPLVWLDARASHEVEGALRDPARLVDSAADGTLVVECVDAASSETLTALGVLLSAAERGRCRVLLTSGRDAAAVGATWTVDLPSLDERRDDLPALVATFARASGLDVALSSTVHAHLASRSYPGNVRELATIVERLARTAKEEHALALGLEEEPPTSPTIRILRGGHAFYLGRRRVDLRASPRLAAVLAALVEAHGEGTECLAAETIAEKAWRGERIIPDAAKNRVYVAVSSLRKLGLRRVIARASVGYSLTGDFVVTDGP